jgi:hypothetical protein
MDILGRSHRIWRRPFVSLGQLFEIGFESLRSGI